MELIDLCTLCIMKNMSLPEAAQSLNTSVSTLQRKLKQRGTTYSDLKLKVNPPQSNIPNQRPVPSVGQDNRGYPPGGSTPQRPTTDPSSFSHTSENADDRRLKTAGGKLTEAILEQAIVKALDQDPIKALPVAFQFLREKKGLSVEDEDTTNTLIQGDKLKRLQEEMFR